MVVLLQVLVLAPDFPLFDTATVRASSAWRLGPFRLTPVAVFISSFCLLDPTAGSVDNLVLPSESRARAAALGSRVAMGKSVCCLFLPLLLHM